MDWLAVVENAAEVANPRHTRTVQSVRTFFMDSSPIGDERAESCSGDETVETKEMNILLNNSFSRQNAQRKSVDSCGTASLCLDIARAPDTANCPDFFAPIN